MNPPFGVRCRVISERSGSRGVNPSLEESPHFASGREVVIGAFSPRRFGVFFFNLSPRPPSPPSWAKALVEKSNSVRIAALRSRNCFDLVRFIPVVLAEENVEQ